MKHRACVLLLASGKSSRITSIDIPKQFLPYKGLPLYLHNIDLFRKIPYIYTIVVALPQEYIEHERERIEVYAQQYGIRCYPVAGGNSRFESMQHAFASLTGRYDYVYIHDVARPFCTPFLIHKLSAYLDEHSEADAVIPVIPAIDTIKVLTSNIVKETLPRANVYHVQTPQCLRYEALAQSLINPPSHAESIFDDASLLEYAGYSIHTIEGEEENIKITRNKDCQLLKKTEFITKTTMGYDVHAYTTHGRPYILGGIHIDSPYQLKAHSDGDVLLHALIDALLAFTEKGDIGECFPDTSSQYDGISSTLLLHEVMEIIRKNNITLRHVDLTVVAQTPKLQPYMKKIHKNIAYLLDIDERDISLKATTEESLGFTGRKEGIKAYALITAQCLYGEKEYPPYPLG